MTFRTYDSVHIGHSHVKKEMECEDHAISYMDPEGRFFLGIVCDGHSDSNCFRAYRGARFGCEAGKEVLLRYFELYFSRRDDEEIDLQKTADRLKRSIHQAWLDKVEEDLRMTPLREEELAGLSADVRDLYLSGRELTLIYGATFLLTAVCEDFFLAMHIGDGEILMVSEGGEITSPLPADPKSEKGSPASLCDGDLFTREGAFRSVFQKEIPLASIATTDGVEGCLDPIQLREFTHGLFRKLDQLEEEGQDLAALNEKQTRYLDTATAYYAAEGHGQEDDCSIAGFYRPGYMTEELKLPKAYVEGFLNALEKDRKAVLSDYRVRKTRQQEKIAAKMGEISRMGSLIGSEKYREEKTRLEEMEQTLRNIESGEQEKKDYYGKRLERYKKYL